jgi:hypothetical protein
MIEIKIKYFKLSVLKMVKTYVTILKKNKYGKY